MDLVVDANIVISCLITSGTKTTELFFSDTFHFLAPEYLKGEIEKHKEEIIKKSGLNADNFDLMLNILSAKINFIPFSDFEKFLPRAIETCPDPNDVEYFAVAMKNACALWSNDKGLKKQDEVKVVSITELLTLF
ncbi:MAG: PIN domain-containing protein [Nanoarchaeota archaeon]|nr:PIN domain-containing protein [Nanoarchaeota archaeon]